MNESCGALKILLMNAFFVDLCSLIHMPDADETLWHSSYTRLLPKLRIKTEFDFFSTVSLSFSLSIVSAELISRSFVGMLNGKKSRGHLCTLNWLCVNMNKRKIIGMKCWAQRSIRQIHVIMEPPFFPLRKIVITKECRFFCCKHHPFASQHLSGEQANEKKRNKWKIRTRGEKIEMRMRSATLYT